MSVLRSDAALAPVADSVHAIVVGVDDALESNERTLYVRAGGGQRSISGCALSDFVTAPFVLLCLWLWRKVSMAVSEMTLVTRKRNQGTLQSTSMCISPAHGSALFAFAFRFSLEA